VIIAVCAMHSGQTGKRTSVVMHVLGFVLSAADIYKCAGPCLKSWSSQDTGQTKTRVGGTSSNPHRTLLGPGTWDRPLVELEPTTASRRC
jgi:hypothetical protein